MHRTFSTILAHCVPLPAAGAPAIMTRSWPFAAATTCISRSGEHVGHLVLAEQQAAVAAEAAVKESSYGGWSQYPGRYHMRSTINPCRASFLLPVTHQGPAGPAALLRLQRPTGARRRLESDSTCRKGRQHPIDLRFSTPPVVNVQHMAPCAHAEAPLRASCRC